MDPVSTGSGYFSHTADDLKQSADPLIRQG